MITLSAHISMLFTEYPYERRIERAAAVGFTSIETWWPLGREADALVASVEQSSMKVSLINAYGGDLEAGERGFLNDPVRRGEADRSIARALELAERVGCQNVHVLLGRRLPGDVRAQWRAIVSVLRAWAPMAEAQGAVLLVEPINDRDIPGYMTPNAGAVAELLEGVDSTAVRMLFDAYHIAKGGADPHRVIKRYAPLVGHVQFADHPGRGAPGTGELDLPRLARELADVGYDGALGLEFDPGPSTEDALDAVLRTFPRLSVL